MGCECIKNIFRRKDDFYEEINDEIKIELNKDVNNINDDDLSEVPNNEEEFCDPNAFNIKKAKLVVEKCLSEDKFCYSQFLHDILSFDDEDFQNLFEGVIDDKNKIYQKYCSSKNKNFFDCLVAKFENFQILLTEWYKEEKYYNHLIDLWKLFPTMNRLKDIYFYEEELNLELKEINYSYWDYDIKESFKKCIGNTPEAKSCEIEKYMEIEFPEIKLILDNTKNYRNNLKNYYEKGMEEYETNLLSIIHSIIQDFTSDIFPVKNEISNIKGSDTLKEAMKNKIDDYLFKKYDKEDKENNDNNNSFINYEKIYESINKIKDGKLLNFIQDILKSNFNISLNILGGINVALGLLDLCTSVHECYKCFFEYDGLNDQFKKELSQIQENFEVHKNLGIIPKDYGQALLKIYQTFELIKKDREDIINLIYRIDKAITNKKKIKKKSILKIVKNIFQIGVAAGGAVLTGGIAGFGIGIMAAASVARVIHHSKKLHTAKKDLKNLRETFEKAIDLEDKIDLELEYLLEKYTSIRNQYLPNDLKNKGI